MKYPIGIQDFRELRTGSYIYVDKSRHIHEILSGGKYFFLSRPRRFGKSLLISTIRELYSGSREITPLNSNSTKAPGRPYSKSGIKATWNHTPIRPKKK
jgi:hypothetical protein